MKKLLLISFLCAFSAIAVLSQTKGQITLEKKRYYLNDKQLDNNELKTLLKSDPESAASYKKATSNYTAAIALIGVGTAFTIYAAVNPPKEDDGPLPGLINDEEMSKWMVPIYCAGGCIIASIPFILSGKKNFKKSISIYNSKHTTGLNNNLKIELGLTHNGVGITSHF